MRHSADSFQKFDDHSDNQSAKVIAESVESAEKFRTKSPDTKGRRFKNRPNTSLEIKGKAASENFYGVDKDKTSMYAFSTIDPKTVDKIRLRTLNSFLRVPKVDHKYHIKETPVIKSIKDDVTSYISQVLKRA